MGDLKKKIVEMGEWHNFCVWANKKWEKEKFDNWKGEELFYFSFLDYFMDEIRFPELVAGWAKERKVEG